MITDELQQDPLYQKVVGLQEFYTPGNYIHGALGEIIKDLEKGKPRKKTIAAAQRVLKKIPPEAQAYKIIHAVINHRWGGGN
jgi:hypothetical protein